MTKVILAHSSCMPSAMLLRDELFKLTGKKFFCYKALPRKATKVILRYGNSDVVKIADTRFNSREFINLTANKLNFSKLMKENGILSPEFRRDTPSDSDFPVMIRKSLSSSGGRGISIAETREEFNRKFKSGYWTPFLTTQFEARIHIFIIDGKAQVSRVFKKEYNGEEGTEPKYPVRTSKNYHFSLRENLAPWKKAMDFSVKIGDILKEKGCMFCTLDIGYIKSKHEYIVFEANSGSGLNSVTAAIYADFLISQGLLD